MCAASSSGNLARASLKEPGAWQGLWDVAAELQPGL